MIIDQYNVYFAESGLLWLKLYFYLYLFTSNQLYYLFSILPGGSSKLLSDASGAAVAALAVIGLALALVTGVTTAPPLVTLFIADLVASLTS